MKKESQQALVSTQIPNQTRRFSGVQNKLHIPSNTYNKTVLFFVETFLHSAQNLQTLLLIMDLITLLKLKDCLFSLGMSRGKRLAKLYKCRAH